MPTVLVSVRLPFSLASILDHLAHRLERTPSQVLDTLIQRVEGSLDEILKVAVDGPFPEKRNLRLSRGATDQLKRATGIAEPGRFIRSLLGYFFSRPEAVRAVFPDAPVGDEWARLLEEAVRGKPQATDAKNIPRPTPRPRGPRPGTAGAGAVLLLLAIMVLFIIGIRLLVIWLIDREPSPNSSPQRLPPSPGDAPDRLPGDRDQGPTRAPGTGEGSQQEPERGVTDDMP